MSKHQSSVAKTRKRKRLQKAKREARPFLALLSAAVTLAMATLVGASSSPQVEQFDPLAVPRTAHVATAQLRGALEAIANDLMVDLTLDDSGSS